MSDEWKQQEPFFFLTFFTIRSGKIWRYKNSSNREKNRWLRKETNWVIWGELPTLNIRPSFPEIHRSTGSFEYFYRNMYYTFRVLLLLPRATRGLHRMLDTSNVRACSLQLNYCQTLIHTFHQYGMRDGTNVKGKLDQRRIGGQYLMLDAVARIEKL